MEEKLKQPRKSKPAQNHQKQTRAQPAAMRKPNENTNTKNHNPIWKNVGFSLKLIQHKEHSSTQALFRTHFATPFFWRNHNGTYSFRVLCDIFSLSLRHSGHACKKMPTK